MQKKSVRRETNTFHKGLGRVRGYGFRKNEYCYIFLFDTGSSPVFVVTSWYHNLVPTVVPYC
jgi:hypothetical protein